MRALRLGSEGGLQRRRMPSDDLHQEIVEKLDSAYDQKRVEVRGVGVGRGSCAEARGVTLMRWVCGACRECMLTPFWCVHPCTVEASDDVGPKAQSVCLHAGPAHQ